MSAMKTGAIGQTRFTKATSIKQKINTVRSGGGVQDLKNFKKRFQFTNLYFNLLNSFRYLLDN